MSNFALINSLLIHLFGRVGHCRIDLVNTGSVLVIIRPQTSLCIPGTVSKLSGGAWWMLNLSNLPAAAAAASMVFNVKREHN